MLSAAALLVAQGAGLLHLVSAEHGWCPAHGEPVEVTGRRAAPAGDQTGVGAAAVAAASDEHCLVLAWRHRSIGIERPARAVMPAVSAPTSSIVPPGPRAALPRYRLAPKTSPPA
jgi:hypothetical protein